MDYNLFHIFLHERQQHVSSGNHICTWWAVNKGTTQGSVSSAYVFNVFLNVPLLFKYADDSTIKAPVSSNSALSDRLVELF